MARLLVAGGTGVLGRAICRQAVDASHEVRTDSRSGQPTDVDDSQRWVEAIEDIAQ